MSRTAARCILVVVRIVSVFNRMGYSLLEWICTFSGDVLQGYLSQTYPLTSTVRSNYPSGDASTVPIAESSRNRIVDDPCLSPYNITELSEQRTKRSQEAKRLCQKSTKQRNETETFPCDSSNLKRRKQSKMTTCLHDCDKIVTCNLRKAKKVIVSYEFSGDDSSISFDEVALARPARASSPSQNKTHKTSSEPQFVRSVEICDASNRKQFCKSKINESPDLRSLEDPSSKTFLGLENLTSSMKDLNTTLPVDLSLTCQNSFSESYFGTNDETEPSCIRNLELPKVMKSSEEYQISALNLAAGVNMPSGDTLNEKSKSEKIISCSSTIPTKRHMSEKTLPKGSESIVIASDGTFEVSPESNGEITSKMTGSDSISCLLPMPVAKVEILKTKNPKIEISHTKSDIILSSPICNSQTEYINDKKDMAVVENSKADEPQSSKSLDSSPKENMSTKEDKEIRSQIDNSEVDNAVVSTEKNDAKLEFSSESGKKLISLPELENKLDSRLKSEDKLESELESGNKLKSQMEEGSNVCKAISSISSAETIREKDNVTNIAKELESEHCKFEQKLPREEIESKNTEEIPYAGDIPQANLEDTALKNSVEYLGWEVTSTPMDEEEKIDAILVDWINARKITEETFDVSDLTVDLISSEIDVNECNQNKKSKKKKSKRKGNAQNSLANVSNNLTSSPAIDLTTPEQKHSEVSDEIYVKPSSMNGGQQNIDAEKHCESKVVKEPSKSLTKLEIGITPLKSVYPHTNYVLKKDGVYTVESRLHTSYSICDDASEGLLPDTTDSGSFTKCSTSPEKTEIDSKKLTCLTQDKEINCIDEEQDISSMRTSDDMCNEKFEDNLPEKISKSGVLFPNEDKTSTEINSEIPKNLVPNAMLGEDGDPAKASKIQSVQHEIPLDKIESKTETGVKGIECAQKSTDNIISNNICMGQTTRNEIITKNIVNLENTQLGCSNLYEIDLSRTKSYLEHLFETHEKILSISDEGKLEEGSGKDANTLDEKATDEENDREAIDLVLSSESRKCEAIVSSDASQQGKDLVSSSESRKCEEIVSSNANQQGADLFPSPESSKTESITSSNN